MQFIFVCFFLIFFFPRTPGSYATLFLSFFLSRDNLFFFFLPSSSARLRGKVPRSDSGDRGSRRGATWTVVSGGAREHVRVYDCVRRSPQVARIAFFLRFRPLLPSCLLYVLDAPYGGTLDLVPADALVERLVDEADEADVVAADQVQAERDLLGVVRVVRVAYDALDRLSEYLCSGGRGREDVSQVRCSSRSFPIWS